MRAVTQQPFFKGECRDALHGFRQIRGADKRQIIGRGVEEMGGFKLRLIARQIGAGRRRHGAQRLFILRLHLRHHFVPCASQGFAQRWVIFQGLGVDHHHVDKLARYLRGAKDFGGFRRAFDNRQLRVPGYSRLHFRGGEGRDDIGIGGIHHGDIFFCQTGFLQAAHQQIVGNGQFRQVDLLAFQIFEGFALAFHHHAVVAFGVAAENKRGAIHAARRRYGQRIHVGHGAAIKLARGILVNRFDIVVELYDIDFNTVFVGPFINDFAVTDGAPRHPACVDGPADIELFLHGGKGWESGQHDQRQHERAE